MPDDSTFAGQWVGDGRDGSHLIIDMDDGELTVRGTARLFFSDGRPGAFCEISFPRGSRDERLKNIPLAWIPVDQANIATTAQMRNAQPEIALPETADIELQWNQNSAVARWKTSLPTEGIIELSRTPGNIISSVLASEINTWEEFKRFALQQVPGTFIFRGQPETLRLRTAFHRSYRKDLVKYAMEDIPLAHRQLTARTKHLFDLKDGQQRGAFWNLLQHHGYPTPLLDWTYSPFVAAFFAYRRRQGANAPSDKVRIFALDKAAWTADFSQLDAVNFARLHFSMLEALAIENPRAIPQQAVSTLTNVDHVEGYIQSHERQNERQYIHAIDLPASLRPDVMIELSLMGITAGSLFPGLDGACEELRGRMFHHQLPPMAND